MVLILVKKLLATLMLNGLFLPLMIVISDLPTCCGCYLMKTFASFYTVLVTLLMV